MEYRIIPKSGLNISTIGIGIGSGSIHESDEKQTAELLDYAEDQGINLIDMALSYPEPMDHYKTALRGRRDKFSVQMHLGISFASGEYARDYRLEAIKRSFDTQMEKTNSDVAEIALFHCIDTREDFEGIMDSGAFDYAVELKKAGVIRHLGFASHTIETCNRFIETGVIDLFMFSVNAAYDMDPAGNDPYGEDSKTRAGLAVAKERQKLYQDCVQKGIGIQVMKAYAGGKLLSDQTSPFGKAMTIPQCLKYALDRPAVMSCILGVRGIADLEDAVKLYSSTEQELDYSFISSLQPEELMGACVYCNHCMPCPKGIDIGVTHKFLDLYLAGDEMAAAHYQAMTKHAGDCIGCGICEKRCPFAVDIRGKMKQAKAAFGS